MIDLEFDDFEPDEPDEFPSSVDQRGRGWISEELVGWMRDQLHPLWWYKAATCREADPDLFFPERGQSAEPAKEICAECPVLNLCLEWALDQGDLAGIWAGTTRRERRKLKRGEEPAASEASKRDLVQKQEQKRRRRLASTLVSDGATLAEIAKKLHLSPYEALGYLSPEQQTALLARV
jgi:WhiB family redox-sensing transcriptional regulator